MNFSARPSIRRSTRVRVCIPVEITGMLPDGESFTEQTYVVAVSKFGARLKSQHELRPGMEIRVKPKAGSVDALFQVVWAGGLPGNSTEVGIQYVKGSNLFGVAFPD